MKKYNIIWSPKSHQDLQNIHFYIEYYLKEKNIANNTVKKILNSISSLSYFPEKYVKIQSVNDKNIRKMIVNNYVIIYKVNVDTRSSFYFTYFSLFSKLFQ